MEGNDSSRDHFAGGFAGRPLVQRICGVAERSDPPVASPDYGSANSMCFVSKTNPATWAYRNSFVWVATMG